MSPKMNKCKIPAITNDKSRWPTNESLLIVYLFGIHCLALQQAVEARWLYMQKPVLQSLESNLGSGWSKIMLSVLVIVFTLV